MNYSNMTSKDSRSTYISNEDKKGMTYKNYDMKLDGINMPMDLYKDNKSPTMYLSKIFY